MAGGASLSGWLAGGRLGPVWFRLPILRRKLAGVDKVFQLLLVLIRVAVRCVPEYAALLGEVFEGGARVTRGAEAELARRFGDRQCASPAQEVEELWRKKRHARLAHRERGQLEPEGREQWSVQLARGVEELGKRLRSGRRDVVGAGGPSLRREDHRGDAIVAMDELEGGIVTGDRRHDLEVQVPGERLRLLRVEAVREAKHEDVDGGIPQREVADIRLDLDNVAHELVG